MSSTPRQLWMDLDESLVDREPFERRERDLVKLGRRSFLTALGLSGVVSLTGCERLPVEKALPLLETDEDSRPGSFVRYASTCLACSAACGMLVTVRDGRPVKLEGHPEHPLSKGGLCALGQATVRGLYDGGRLRKPQLDGSDADWKVLDARVAAGLKALAGKELVVLAPTIVSPTARRTIMAFLEPHSGRLVEHEPGLHGHAAALEAYRLLDGEARQPVLDLDAPETLLTLGGDLLGTGAEHVAHTRQYADRRRARKDGRPFRHVHVEGSLTLTGAASDQRIQATASERALLATSLLKAVASRASGDAAELAKELTKAVPTSGDAATVQALIAELKPGRALVVSGSRSVAEQLAVALLNRLLGAEEECLSLQASTRGHGDAEVAKLALDLSAGKIGGLIVLGHNPVEQLPGGDALAAKIAALPLSVAISTRPTATAAACKIVAAAHHQLERWGDAAPQAGVLTLAQPTIRPLFDTRDPMENFLRWAASPVVDYRAHLEATWATEVAVGVNAKVVWSDALSRGMATTEQAATAFALALREPEPEAAAEPEAKAAEPEAEAETAPAGPQPDRAAMLAAMATLALKAGDLEVELIEEVGPRDGRGTFNPWLRELPDPITRASWTATVRLAPALAKAQGIEDGDGVRVTVGDSSVEMQARIVPGQHPKVVAVPVGYGIKDGDAGEATRNGYRLAKLGAGGMIVAGLPASVARVDGKRKLPLMQWHSSTEGRPILHQVESVDEKIEHHEHGEHSLWGGDENHYSPHWHMTIDLDACTGCSACVVACQAENNLPVVGPQNITDHRDMYWLRIDRYYQGDADNPEVLFEPMLCAQCDNAPCETVCPVAATVHSHDGLNMQAYNRCVGTRYCANNCPYKVRRFNWFDFTHKDPLERMVLNPDVVVRERGTMEKCTFCVQRIQLARIEGKARGETGPPEVQTACQQSCPARAIHFGDANSDEQIAEERHAGRSFQALADLGVMPSITYLARVRNRKAPSGGKPT